MAKIDTYFKKLPSDVVQIGVGAAAGAVVMTVAEQVVAKQIRNGVVAWRKKIQQKLINYRPILPWVLVSCRQRLLKTW